jgi:hypothetical protein
MVFSQTEQKQPNFVMPLETDDQDSGQPKRITIQLSGDQFKYLQWLAKKQNVSQAEALRKALATESYLYQARERGGQILIKDGESIHELVLR